MDWEQISGPAWLSAEKYDLVATIPADITKEQFQQMLQSLLAERFKLRAHHETRNLAVFELVVAKNGHKLEERETPAPAKEGFPELPAGRPGMAMRMDASGRSRLNAHQQSMSSFARMLRSPAGRIVLDKTGLTAKYDFTLECNLRSAAAPVTPDDDAVPDVFSALQQQLGLRLVDRKVPFDVIVVDSVEKIPTEN